MILRAPSGFYRTILPPNIGNNGNVTYTISSGEPPRIELNFPKTDKMFAIGSIISDKIINSPDVSILNYNKNNVSSGIEPRPIGFIIEFNDQFKSLDIKTSDSSKEFVSARYSDNNTVNAQLFTAYNEFQLKLLKISEELDSLLTEINNDEIRINMNIAKIQAIDEALKILPDDNALIDDKKKVSSEIDKLENNIFTNKSLISGMDNKKSQYIDSIQKLSRVI